MSCFSHTAALIALALGHVLGGIAAHRGLCRVHYLRAAVSVAALAEAASTPACRPGHRYCGCDCHCCEMAMVVRMGEAELVLWYLRLVLLEQMVLGFARHGSH